MSEDNPIPPAFKIFKDHAVTILESQMFGIIIGRFLDAGMTDLELLTVTEEFSKMIRSAARDSSMLDLLSKQAEVISKHIEHPRES